MNAKNDLFIAIGILLLLVVAWLMVGGPGQEGGGSFFTKPTLPSVSSIRAGDDRERQNRRTNADERSSLARDATNIEAVQRELERLAARGEPSPFRGRVLLTRSSAGARKTDPQDEFVRIRVSGTQPVAITGWQLESSVSGARATIKEAADPPAINNVSVERPITLAPGEEAIITTGRSPIGVSFRENICTGYFEQFQDFSPRLDRSCPAPEKELAFADDPLRDFDNACLAFIERMPRCTFHLGELPPESSSACRAFIANDLTYRGCVEHHENDPDFHSKTWRIFLGQSKELWKSEREVIKLLDREGKVVDVLTY